jgi:DNA polymerase III subunit delta'
MTDLLLHSSTKKALERLQSQQPHAIALFGPKGAGKRTVARRLAEELLQTKLQSGSNYFEVAPGDNDAITIDQAREIKQFVKLKISGNTSVKRVVIISDAQTLQESAQNTLLKLIEEPPVGTVFILTASAQETLLPTLISRLTTIKLMPVSAQQLSQLPKAKHLDNQELARIFHLSGGHVGLANRLLSSNDVDDSLMKDMQIAKQLIASKRYDRLGNIEFLLKNHETAMQVLFCMQKILEYKLHSTHDESVSEKIRHVISAQDDLNRRVNKKLVFTDLFMKL